MANRSPRNPRPSRTVDASPLPFVTAALASIAESDNPQIYGDLLTRAHAHTDGLTRSGAFNASAIEAAIVALIEADGRSSLELKTYRAAVRAFDAVQGQLADHITTVRYHERDAAFALGMALGLRLGGAR